MLKPVVTRRSELAFLRSTVSTTSQCAVVRDAAFRTFCSKIHRCAFGRNQNSFNKASMTRPKHCPKFNTHTMKAHRTQVVTGRQICELCNLPSKPCRNTEPYTLVLILTSSRKSIPHQATRTRARTYTPLNAPLTASRQLGPLLRKRRRPHRRIPPAVPRGLREPQQHHRSSLKAGHRGPDHRRLPGLPLSPRLIVPRDLPVPQHRRSCLLAVAC